MFKELSPLLRKGDTLVLALSRVDATQFRVTVTPKLFTMDGEKGEDRKSLNQPVVINGTLDELDSPEFAATLERFTASTTGLRMTIDDVEAAHKAAKEGKTAKADKDKGKGEEKKPATNPIKDRLTPKPKTEEPVSATLI